MESRPASRFTGKRVHFIGIGGSGMNGLARILLDCGATVTGSEPHPTAQTFDLIKRGAKISRTQGGELLSRDIDLVVRTALGATAESCKYGTSPAAADAASENGQGAWSSL